MEEWVNIMRIFEKVDFKPGSTKSAFGGAKLSTKSLQQFKGVDQALGAPLSQMSGSSATLPGINYETFKKTFFPHLCHAINEDSQGSDDET